MARRQGWGVRVARWREAADGSPWSILSFRRGQGLLSQIFVIAYGLRPEAWSSPVFDRPLYDARNAPVDGPTLRRVWLSTCDLDASGLALEALGFAPAGEVLTDVTPFTGKLYRGGAGDLVLSAGETDAVIRLDLSGAGVATCEPFGDRLLLVIGETS